MKEEMYFYYWQLRDIMVNCSKNIKKVTLVADIVGTAIDNSKILKKELFLSNIKKRG